MTSASATASSSSSSARLRSLLPVAPSPTSSASSTTSRFNADDLIDPIGIEFADRLRAFEESLDAAYAAASELGLAAIRVKSARRLSTGLSQPFFQEVDQAKSAVVAARGHSAKSHRVAEQIGRIIGVPVALYGDEAKDSGDKPKG